MRSLFFVCLNKFKSISFKSKLNKFETKSSESVYECRFLSCRKAKSVEGISLDIS